MARQVLILDDDPELGELLAQLLAFHGFTETVLVRSFAELELAQHAALGTDVALLDINLGPSLPSGLDAYAWLRSKNYRGAVVFFTGHARTNPLVQRALGIPGVQLVEKPVSVDRLAELLM